MPKPLVVTIPHQLGREEAQRRLRGGLETARGQLSAVNAQLHETWTEEGLNLRVGALGQTIDSRITVADLAHIAGLSEGWFTRAFARSQNTTPQRWITHLRLTEARRLMANPALQLAEIAAATGFSDQAHLTRNFGRAFGQTPAAWRRDAFAQNSSNHVGSVQAAPQFPT